MDLQLKGKTAIVTGASKGIGAGIARALAAEGAKVVVNYNGAKADADKVVNDITAAGGKAIAIQANVSVASDVARLFETAVSTYGPLEVLVNNAGVYSFAPIDAFTEEDYRRMYDTNILAVYLTTKESLKHFPVGGGSIVNVSSIVSTNPVANSGVYSATKAAVDTLSKAHALELAPRKVRVNVVAPGFTETEGTSGFANSDFVSGMIAATPLGRSGRPQDIADAVVYLASDRSGWVTGERISVSGGLK